MFQTALRPQQIHPSVFIGEGAVIVGDVTLAESCSVWFNASLRGDTESILIGTRTNVQEAAIFHADPGFPAVVGSGVTVGHGAIIHGAQIGNNVVVGMRAVILNGAVIGDNCVIGAASLVTEGKVYPPGALILGSPANVVRMLTPDEIGHNRRSAQTYVERAQAFKSAQEER